MLSLCLTRKSTFVLCLTLYNTAVSTCANDNATGPKLIHRIFNTNLENTAVSIPGQNSPTDLCNLYKVSSLWGTKCNLSIILRYIISCFTVLTDMMKGALQLERH